MKSIEITPAKYAQIRGCSVQYIHKVLKDGDLHLLPEVLSVKKYSRFYVLVVLDTLSENSFIKLRPKRKKGQ